jgi:hypothetical protein
MRFPRVCSRAVPVRGRPANFVVDPYNVENEITLLLSSFLNYYFKLYLITHLI